MSRTFTREEFYDLVWSKPMTYLAKEFVLSAARQREEERQRRESVLRQKHIDERRSKALDSLLEEMASLDRLRRLVSSLRAELEADASARIAVLLTFAEEKLARRELALSADGLERRLEESRLFAEDDDHDFRPPAYY